MLEESPRLTCRTIRTPSGEVRLYVVTETNRRERPGLDALTRPEA